MLTFGGPAADSPHVPPPASPPSGRIPVRSGACAELDRYATIRLVPLAPTTADADLGLLGRIVVRDESALADLYDRHSRIAYSVIMRILRSPSDAVDVL